MAKIKRQFTPAEKRARKAAKAQSRQMFETVFIHGKQVKIKRPPTIDGIPADQFMEENADPIWLHQNGFWELLP